MKTLYFLSGLPRSGSTVLGSLLSQHPEIHVTATSPLFPMIFHIDEAFKKVDKQYTYDKDNIAHNVFNAVIKNFHNHIKEPYIIDKHRAWPLNLGQFKTYAGQEPKVLCTNRRISEIVVSYITLAEKDPNNFIDSILKRNGKETNNQNRAEEIFEKELMAQEGSPYKSVMHGLENFRQNMHFVDYNELMDNPQEILKNIYKFLDIEPFEHNFDNISNRCGEQKDSEGWGLAGLHDIRPKLKRTNRPPEEVLGEELTKHYDSFNIDVNKAPAVILQASPSIW